LRDYNRSPVVPFFLIESTYEGEHNASAVQIRRQAYWAILCGGMGHIIGNRPIWLFDPGWAESDRRRCVEGDGLLKEAFHLALLAPAGS